MVAILKGLWELIKGMGITGKHLGKHAVTVQYPEEKWPMPERSRGVVVLLSDKEDGSLNCTACELCMRACPTAAIRIDAPRDENKRKVLKSFEIDFALCCFCGLCEESCNFSAIKLTGKYEFSTIDIHDTIWDVNKLQETGRDVDYVDTRKKKAPKPDPKPAPPQEDNPKVTEVKPEEKAVANPGPDAGEKKEENENSSEEKKAEGEA